MNTRATLFSIACWVIFILIFSIDISYSQVFFSSDLENQSVSCWNNRPNGGGWNLNGCDGWVNIGSFPVELSENEITHSGTKAIKVTYKVNEDRGGAMRLFTGRDHVFMQYYNYFVDPYDHGRGEKIGRLSSGGGSNLNFDIILYTTTSNVNGVSPISSFKVAYNGGPNDWGALGTDGSVLTHNQWHCIEVEVLLNTPGASNGLVRLWVDGNLMGEKLNLNIRGNTSNQINRAMFGGWFSNGGTNPAVTNIRYIDDVTLSDSYIGTGNVNSGPFISNLFPPANSINIPKYTDVNFQMTDADGIDTTSLSLKINGQEVASSATFFAITNGYLVNYKSPTDYQPGSTVNVSVSAKDLLGNATQVSWSFVIETATPPPPPPPSSDTIIFGSVPNADYPGTSVDTYIDVGGAAVNHSTNATNLNTYTWPQNTAANRIVMKWDLSALPPNTSIQKAVLSLYMYGYEGTGGDANYEVTAHKIINVNADPAFSTWNTYDGTHAWSGGQDGGAQDMAPQESSAIIGKTATLVNWDITQMVKDWIANPAQNFGLMLNSDLQASANSNRLFRPTEYSNANLRPRLTVYLNSTAVPKVPQGISISK